MKENTAMNIMDEAIFFATRAHSGSMRKGHKIPYILHPMEVAAVAASITDDIDVIVAGLLHDVVEDAGVTLDEIREKFGERVAVLVAAETENKRPDQPKEATWRIRKEETMEILRTTDDIGIKILVLGDKVANMRSFYYQYLEEGDKLWEHFHQKDPKEQYWYYHTIAELTSELKDTPAWQEYNRLIALVFEHN